MVDNTYGPKVYRANQGDDLVFKVGAKFDLSASTTHGKGIIPINLYAARSISSNDIGANGATPAGTILTSDSAPKLIRINAATDKGVRVQWAASSSVEIALGTIVYPYDLDDTAAITVNLLAAMGGATDTPTIAVGYFEGIGDTNAGGNTAAVTGTTLAKYSVTIAASDVAMYSTTNTNFASITLTPGAHTTDVLNLYAAWIEYTKKITLA